MPDRIPPRKYTISTPQSYPALDPFKPPPPETAEQRSEPFARQAGRIVRDVRFTTEVLEVATAPAPPPPAAAPAPPAHAEPPTAPPLPKRAVWIVHGMGQQVPFETLDNLAEGIMSVTSPADGTEFKPRFSAVKIGDSVVERIELNVRFRDEQPLELHLYEAYWAPITEGQVKLADVISFLFDGSLRGILNALKAFQRVLFGTVAPFKIPKRNAGEILAALATVAALIVLNAVILSAGAVHYGLAGQKLPATEANWAALTAIAGALTVVALAFGAVLFLAGLTKPRSLPRGGRIIVRTLSWIAFVFTLLTIILGAFGLGYDSVFASDTLAKFNGLASQIQALITLTALVIGLLVLVAATARGWNRSEQRDLHGTTAFVFFFVVSFTLFVVSCLWFGAVLTPSLTALLASIDLSFLPPWLFMILKDPTWIWPLLFLLSWQVRELLIEYVGDVAAYITPNKLDRFCKIRQDIKDLAYASASAVYFAQDAHGAFLYDKVAVVGHSLGSVIAYDTLNKLINQDRLAFTKFDVIGRTCLLETFGSPLDKIAFFFTIQGKDMFQVREQLAASVQPLISDPASRTIPWINVYSTSDIISGKVKFYDLPSEVLAERIRELREEGCTDEAAELEAAKRVQPCVDPDAVIPLVAHVEYWQNQLVWRQLLNALSACAQPTVKAIRSQ